MRRALTGGPVTKPVLASTPRVPRLSPPSLLLFVLVACSCTCGARGGCSGTRWSGTWAAAAAWQVGGRVEARGGTHSSPQIHHCQPDQAKLADQGEGNMEDGGQWTVQAWRGTCRTGDGDWWRGDRVGGGPARLRRRRRSSSALSGSACWQGRCSRVCSLAHSPQGFPKLTLPTPQLNFSAPLPPTPPPNPSPKLFPQTLPLTSSSNSSPTPTPQKKLTSILPLPQAAAAPAAAALAAA